MTDLEEKIADHLSGFIERQTHLEARLQRIETMENSISDTIEKTVNGKIDAIQATLKEQDKVTKESIVIMDNHIETHKVIDNLTVAFQENAAAFQARVEPYIKKAEEDKEFYEGAEKRGKKIVFWGGVLAAIGIIGATIKYLFK